MLRSWRILPIFAVALLFSASSASACPNCKEAVAAQDTSTPEGKAAASGSLMGGGYNYSVLFMMAMPFALLGTGALMITRAVKRGTLPEF